MAGKIAQGNEQPAIPATGSELAVADVDDAATASADADVDSGDDSHDGSHEIEDETEELARSHKLTPEQQAAFNKAIGKKTAQRRRAEEKAAELEKERDALKAERDELKGKVGDDAVLAAAQQAGVLPEYVSADDARTVAAAEQLRAEVKNLKRLVRAGEDYTGVDANGNERTWSARQLADLLDAAEERLERNGPKAERIKAKAADEIRADIEAGRQARLGKAKVPATVKPATQTRTAVPPALPGEGGGKRRDPRADAGATVDWSKVESPETMREQMLREERARRGKG